MICLGVDPGQSRVGLALGQDSLALALETIDFADALDRIDNLLLDKSIERIYVGLPISLSGETTQSTKRALDFAISISKRVATPIFVIDERLTTAESLRLSQQLGKSAKESKSYIDAEAARLILESAISSSHSAGVELGEYLARN